MEPREIAIKLNYNVKMVAAEKFGFLFERAAREVVFYAPLCRSERNSLQPVY